MPTACRPDRRSASPPTAGSAKKPSLPCECAAGIVRQHSRLPNTTSALRNSAPTRRNGTVGSATFIKLTSPVRIIVKDIAQTPCSLSPRVDSSRNAAADEPPGRAPRAQQKAPDQPGLLAIRTVKLLYSTIL